MDTVDENGGADEERGVELGSLRDGGGGDALRVEIDGNGDGQLDVENGSADGLGTAGQSSPASNHSNSAPGRQQSDGSGRERGRGPVRSFMNRFRRSDGHPHPRKLEPSASGGIAHDKWRSMGTRRIRFASQRSDVNENELRGIVATPLDSETAKPMGAGERFLRNIQNEVGEAAPNKPGLFGRSSTSHGGVGGGAAQDEPAPQMYRLQATRGARDVGCFRRTLRFFNALVNCGALTESATEQNLYLGFGNPNRWLIDFFFWLFRKGWSAVLVLSVVWFYVLVLLFALLIVWASHLDDDCVRVGGVKFGELDNRSLFMDAFSLSWNTFSTVGYGSTYPGLSAESDRKGDGRCAFINFITSIEAFVGILFAGFIGAILFAKVTRITQRADVLFSDPLTVRYGSGVDVQKVEDDEDNADGDSRKGRANMTPLQKFKSIAKKVGKPSPFPVITFRIANEMNGTLGGEIISVSVNAVVLIESTRYDDQVSEDLAKQIAKARRVRETERKAKLRKTASKRPAGVGDTERTERMSERSDRTSDISSSEDGSSRSERRRTENAMTYLQGLNALAYRAKWGKKMKIDEEEGGSGSKIVPRMVFTKLKLETSEHPLFKRIWRFKHIIDQDSPLLTAEAQRAVMENGGRWPWDWNNHESVRRAIRFNQMVVSFTGISNISGASVYKQKVYDYVDTAVGYQFANALYRGRRGNLKVDLRLVNDVIEQNGGGGEPLSVAGRGHLAKEVDDKSDAII